MQSTVVTQQLVIAWHTPLSSILSRSLAAHPFLIRGSEGCRERRRDSPIRVKPLRGFCPLGRQRIRRSTSSTYDVRLPNARTFQCVSMRASTWNPQANRMGSLLPRGIINGGSCKECAPAR